MKTSIETERLLVASSSPYAVRLARSLGEVQAAQRLRFAVFNVELGEGTEASRLTGLDEDPFDAAFDQPDEQTARGSARLVRAGWRAGNGPQRAGRPASVRSPAAGTLRQ